MKKLIMAVFLTSLVIGVVSPAFAVNLTSLTLEKSTAIGAWTNAPGGIWSSNLGDPFAQLGVRQNGVFLNTPGNGLDLGEISIDLLPGLNTFELFGTSSTGGSDYYGLALFFDHNASPPDMAVYNSNGSSGPFAVTPAGTTISGSANGGMFPDIAPGSSIFSAPDGSTVELVGFNVVYDASNIVDIVSWGNIAADGYVDTHAVLELNYTPVPVPGTMLLLSSGLISLIGFRKKFKNNCK
ncbi:MAG: PEP-CTERM sorting domain-containing protein [Proteobacteria bacterium]|nr:PEP-CTERM sorting domain-containing protein [Pseudomonadota bacterium]